MRFTSVLVAVGLAAAMALPTEKATAAASDAQGASAADAAFLSALAHGDKKAAASMLRQDFSRITADGDLLKGAKAAGTIDAMAANTKEEVEVQRHFYGRLATVRGTHEGMRFLRVWAESKGKWRLFTMIETRVVPTERASVEAQAGQGDCENPCRTVPYKPKTAMDKAILATWQETKRIEWKPDAAAWARYIGEEFMIINNTTVRTRAEREVIAKRQEASGIGTPGDPILAMDIRDFGDNAAVMFSKHFPVRGGKPYNNVRIWVFRDNRWQLTISQQSELKSASPIPAVASK